jgi:HSP20 family molecular chaperone IbpA
MASYRRTGSNLYDMVDRFLNDGFSVNTPLRNIILDVQEFDDRYLIEADVPGVDKKDIDVTFNNDYLKIAVNDREDVDAGSSDQQTSSNEASNASTDSGANAASTSDASVKTESTDGDDTPLDASDTTKDSTTESDTDAQTSTNSSSETQSTSTGTSGKNDDMSHYIHRERLYATLNRVIYLKGATSKGIKAELKDGVLTLTVPKREDAMNQNQKIEID